MYFVLKVLVDLSNNLKKGIYTQKPILSTCRGDKL